MHNTMAKWVRGLGGLVLMGTVVVANVGTTVPLAGAAPPLGDLLTVLNEINAKLNALTNAVGGIQEANHTQRWDQNLPAAQRYVTLPAFNNQAVLDKNTGLVWE